MPERICANRDNFWSTAIVQQGKPDGTPEPASTVTWESSAEPSLNGMGSDRHEPQDIF